MPSSQFKVARDELLSLRENYSAAYSSFHWPELGRFNWALDWFDAHLAAGAHASRTALKIVGEDACEWTFSELSLRSNAVANALREAGVGRGDKIMLMLGNCSALWLR